MDGLVLLKKIGDACIPLVLFDPQYRGVLDRQRYGHEGTRLKDRFNLSQMSDALIQRFFQEIDRILVPSGHVMLWVDIYILLNTVKTFIEGTSLELVDMIVWNKRRIGMGYRSRRCSEYLVVFQKPPVRVKGVWTVRNIPDVWDEKVQRNGHTHAKPIHLQEQLILAVTEPDDIVVDPCAGGYPHLKRPDVQKDIFWVVILMGERNACPFLLHTLVSIDHSTQNPFFGFLNCAAWSLKAPKRSSAPFFLQLHLPLPRNRKSFHSLGSAE